MLFRSDGTLGDVDFYGVLFLLRHECHYVVLFYCGWKCACVCADFPVAGVCGAACLYFCASCVFWHDGRVACRAGDGGGDDGALRGVGAAK